MFRFWTNIRFLSHFEILWVWHCAWGIDCVCRQIQWPLFTVTLCSLYTWYNIRKSFWTWCYWGGDCGFCYTMKWTTATLFHYKPRFSVRIKLMDHRPEQMCCVWLSFCQIIPCSKRKLQATRQLLDLECDVHVALRVSRTNVKLV